MSYLPLVTPGIRLPNGAFCHSAVTPSFLATASNRSTSLPTILSPSVNWFGA